MSKGQFVLPNYISKIIKDHLFQHFGIEEVTFSIECGSKNGDSYSGDVYRVIIQSDRKTASDADDVSSQHFNVIAKNPHHQFILKTTPENEQRRQLHNISQIFSRECYSYLQILPALKAFQLRHLREPEIFNNFPNIIAGSSEPGKEYILTEDLSIYGFINFDRPVPLGFNECATILKAVARLHAVSFAFKDQCLEEFLKLTEPLDEIVFKNHIPEYFINFLKERVDCALTTLSDNDENVKIRMLDFQNNFGASMIECVAQKDDAVILHGDCWISNILYRDHKSNLDYDVNFLDWAGCRYGTPAIDISYFIFCCTDLKLRTRLPELLQIYHATLSERITALGSDPIALFPYNKLEQHMKNYAKFGLGMALMTLQFTSCDPKEMPDVVEMMNTLNYSEIKDITAMLTSKPAYKKRMSEVCRDMVKFGYI